MTQEKSFEVSGCWSGNNTRRGFGMSKNDRCKYISKSIDKVTLHMPNSNQVIIVALPPSFWNKCHKLINAETKKWMHDNGYGEWERDNPPRFRLIEKAQNEFEVVILPK